MKTQLSILFLIMAGLLMPAHDLAAQDPAKKAHSRYGFSLGFSHSQVKDLALVPIVHKGPGFIAGAIFSRADDKGDHRLEFNGGFNSLKSSFEEEAGSFLINTSLRYRYGHRIFPGNEKSAFYLGGRIGLEATEGIYENWDENHYYWLTSYSLGLNGLYVLKLTGLTRLTCEVNLPIVALVSRTPVKNQLHEEQAQFTAVVTRIHENPKAVTWPAHFSPDVRIGYNYDIKGKVTQAFFWQVNLINNSISGSDRVRMIHHQIGIEFLF